MLDMTFDASPSLRLNLRTLQKGWATATPVSAMASSMISRILFITTCSVCVQRYNNFAKTSAFRRGNIIRIGGIITKETNWHKDYPLG
jgi:hypothetical protein